MPGKLWKIDVPAVSLCDILDSEQHGAKSRKGMPCRGIGTRNFIPFGLYGVPRGDRGFFCERWERKTIIHIVSIVHHIIATISSIVPPLVVDVVFHNSECRERQMRALLAGASKCPCCKDGWQCRPQSWGDRAARKIDELESRIRNGGTET